MAVKLLFATQNPGKLREIQTILAGKDLEVLSPAECYGLDSSQTSLSQLEVEETGNSFTQNAFLKAQAFATRSMLLTAADDSGLAVEALDGFPGVKSARWINGSDQERNQALLEKLKNVSNRKAKFVTVICLYDPILDETKYFKGEIQGRIAKQPQGNEGFGYDPIFIPEGYNQTFAQLGLDLKNKLSHRHKALKKLKSYLQKNKVT
jgi:XTP/dITP diphosphohydrolase